MRGWQSPAPTEDGASRLPFPMSPRPHRLLPLIALAACVQGAGAESVPFDVQKTSAVRELLPALDASDFAQREAASNRLRDDATLSIDAIGSMLAEPGLTPEQARRLVTAFRSRFAVSPRPAIGIGFELVPTDPRGVLINRLNRGLPAIDAGLIQLGDLVVSLDGVKLIPDEPAGQVPVEADRNAPPDLQAAMARRANQNRTTNRMISLIQSYDPGDVVTLEILRLTDPSALKVPKEPDPRQPGVLRLTVDPAAPRERILVQAKLGLYANLDPINGGRSDQAYLMQAYGEEAMEARLKRLGVSWPGPQVIDAVAQMRPGSENPPPAFSGKLALGLAGPADAAQGPDRPWNAQMNMVRGVDNQGRIFIRAVNGVVQAPAGIDVRLIPQLATKQRPSQPSGSEAGAQGTGDAVALGTGTAIKRDLARLAELQSELARADALLADRTLDAPSQREAQKRAAELRAEVDALTSALRTPQYRFEPTVSAETEDALTR